MTVPTHPVPAARSFEATLARAQAAARAAGVLESNHAPAMYRHLWRLGVRVRPPYFGGFVSNALIAGVPFALAYGAIAWLETLLRDTGRWLSTAPATAIGAGALFGVALASYYRWTARRLGLPSWQMLREQAQREPPA